MNSDRIHHYWLKIVGKDENDIDYRMALLPDLNSIPSSFIDQTDDEDIEYLLSCHLEHYLTNFSKSIPNPAALDEIRKKTYILIEFVDYLEFGNLSDLLTRHYDLFPLLVSVFKEINLDMFEQDVVNLIQLVEEYFNKNNCTSNISEFDSESKIGREFEIRFIEYQTAIEEKLFFLDINIEEKLVQFIRINKQYYI